LNSNVAIGDSGRLIEKLKAVAANSDIDVAKYGEVDHQLSSSPEGNAVLTLVIGNDVDCGGGFN
jgi:hypothetical protein